MQIVVVSIQVQEDLVLAMATSPQLHQPLCIVNSDYFECGRVAICFASWTGAMIQAVQHVDIALLTANCGNTNPVN